MKTQDKQTMSSNETSVPQTTRRNFLIGTGLAGVAAAAAVVGRAPSPAPEATAAPEAEPTGYRETEHVRRYYGTTRI